MEIVEITQSDDLMVVARKCAINFRQLAWHIDQAVKRQNRIDVEDIMIAVSELSDEITRMINVTMPNEVANQIAAQDIPGMVSDEVSGQVAPPVGTYVMADSMPTYAGTTWQQAGNIVTDTPATIPLWKRIS